MILPKNADYPKHSIKVGILGSKKVGKTTLANLLNGHLKAMGQSSDLVSEVARICPLPINEHTNLSTAYWLLGAQISSEALVAASRDFVICDRTVLDLYPFTKYGLRKMGHGHITKAASYELGMIQSLIQSYLLSRPYQFLFYVPIDASHQVGNRQFTSFQRKIDFEFRAFLSELGINFYELDSSTSHQRLQQAITYMNNRNIFISSYNN